MRVLFNMIYAQGLSVYTGIVECGKKILEGLANEVDVLLVDEFDVDKEFINKYNVVSIHAKKNSKEMIDEIYKLSFKYDIFFSPYQLMDYRIKLAPNCKLYQIIHDLTQLDYRKLIPYHKYQLYYKNLKADKIKYLIKQIFRMTKIWYLSLYRIFKYNAKKSSLIITDSDCSKKRITKELKIDNNLVKVYYPPLKIYRESFSSSLTYKNYFLFVSSSRYHKNVVNAIKAFDIYKDKTNNNTKFIVTGNCPKKIINLSRHKEDIINLSYLNDSDLEYLYKNADCLIFASFAEGFGYPPLEAMKYGTKYITSTIRHIINFEINISQNTLLWEVLLFSRAINLCPYDVNPNIATNVKYVTSDNLIHTSESNQKFKNIDIDSLFETNSIQIAELTKTVNGNTVPSGEYTLAAKAKFFNSRDVAKEFLRDLTNIPLMF